MVNQIKKRVVYHFNKKRGQILSSFTYCEKYTTVIILVHHLKTIGTPSEEVRPLTDMKRITVSLTDELVDAIEQMKETKEIDSSSYSEIIRHLLRRGLEMRAGHADKTV